MRPISNRHSFECQLRRADLHGDGTVGNVVYIDYLQEARLDLLRHHDTSPTPNPGEGLVVVRTVVEYLRPVRLADAPLTVETWACDVRAASFTLGYELLDRDRRPCAGDDIPGAVRVRDRTTAPAGAGGAGPVADDVRRTAVRSLAR